MEISEKLRRARLDKGVSLAQIANATKISTRVLERIEGGHFDELPGGLLTRGHLRAFARELGLEPEEIVSQYRAEFERTSPEDEPFTLRKSYADTEQRASLAPAILTVAFAVIIYVAFMRPADTTSEIDTVAGMTALDVAAAPAIQHAIAPAHAARPGTSPVRAADPEGLQIELRPQSDCWVSATADGRLVIYRLMNGGERETIDAVDAIRLRVGDAGVLSYTVNGLPGRSLGAPGEAVTVQVTSDNATTWVTGEPVRPAPGTPPAIAGTHQITGI